jgi:hypothetical protein
MVLLLSCRILRYRRTSVLCESSGLEVVSSCNSYRKSSEEKSTNLLQRVRNFLFVDVCTKKDGLTLDLGRRLVLGITVRVHIWKLPDLDSVCAFYFVDVCSKKDRFILTLNLGRSSVVRANDNASMESI